MQRHDIIKDSLIHKLKNNYTREEYFYKAVLVLYSHKIILASVD